jgi:HD-like signal output (HDOD) protein
MAATSEKSFDVVAAAESIGVRPETALQLMQLTNDEDATIEQLQEVIDADPIMATRTLKLANSPFYGMSSRIARIDRAITMLGRATIAKLAASASIASAFKSVKIDVPGIGKDTAWQYSVAVAFATDNVVNECGHLVTVARNRLAADGFITGLIHDIGLLVQAKHSPAEFGEAVSASQKSGVPLIVHERRLIGLDHAEIGRQLADHWKLPEHLTQGIAYHHDPLAAESDYRDLACVVHAAAQLVRRADVPSLDGDTDMEHLCPALEHLHIDTRRLDLLAADIGERVKTIEL